MKSILKPLSFLFMLTLLLSGCGNSGSPGAVATGATDGGDSGANAGNLDAGGAGLTLLESVDALGAVISVNFSSAVDINDFNEVVGFVEMSAGEPFTAGLWTVDTSGTATAAPKSLPALTGNTFSAAFALDEHGNAIGQSARGMQRVAVRWPSATALPVELPALAVGGDSAAFHISADGTLIVGEAQDAAARTRAVVWVADAQGDFNSPPIVLPVNIFNSGQVLSSYSTASGIARVGAEIWVVGEALDGGGRYHAALWRSTNQVVFSVTDLAEPGETASAAYAVNDGGLIVGETEAAAGLIPIQWSADAQGVFQRTGLAVSGSAVAVNANDRVAGWSGAVQLATIWDGTLAETLFTTESQAYNLNDDIQPLVVGRIGNHGFVKRVD